MYVSLSVSRSGFICMFFSFYLYICTYLPTLRSFACMWFDTENIFSLPFVLYLFSFSHAILSQCSPASYYRKKTYLQRIRRPLAELLVWWWWL